MRLSAYLNVQLLSLIGIYGVTAFSVGQRAREIGVRIAVGAGQRRILGQMLWQSMRLVLIGLVLGAGGALLVGGILESLLYGVQYTDPAVFAIVAVTLTAAATAAAWIPSRRASGIDVVTALRLE